MHLPSDDVGTWLAPLRQYQREQIEQLLSTGKTPEEVAELWLDADGSDATLGLGARRSPKKFGAQFQNELRKFFCGDDPTYAKERSEIFARADMTKVALVSGVSAAVSPHLGTTTTLLIPAVALMLHVIGKAGIQAWCQCQKT